MKLWGNGIFFPRIHGFRLLCACLASKTEVKKSGKTEGSVAQTRRIAASGDENGVSRQYKNLRTPLSRSRYTTRYTTRKVKWINAFMGDLKAPLKKKQLNGKTAIDR